MSAPYIPILRKKKQLQLGQLLINNNIRGLIAVTGTLDQVSNSFSSDYVTSENYPGGYLAGSYLACKNHQRIGFVAGRRDAYTIVQRTSGFLNALKDAKLPAYPKLYSYDLNGQMDGKEQMSRLLLFL